MFNFAKISSLFLCSSLAVVLGGCGTTATVSRVNAPAMEGRIVSSDQRAIYVQTAGDTFPIARDEISDIDHPGNVAATIGAIVTGYGIANIAVGAENCDRQGAAYCTGVFLPAAIGLPIMAYGLGTWINSVRSAGPRKDKTEPSIAIVPTVSVDKKNEYVGVSAAVRF